MRRCWIPVAAVSLVLVVVPLLDCDRRANDPAVYTQALSEKYSLIIDVAHEPFSVKAFYWSITGTSATQEDIRKYLPLLASEFTLYPPAFVARTGLERIVLCRDLAISGTDPRAAVPDFVGKTFYLDVAGSGVRDRTYLRWVIHHEFFHIVDYCDDGRVSRDDAWEALNPNYFAYGGGGSQFKEMRPFLQSAPGFVSEYAKAAVEEDKAEVFAGLIVGHDWIKRRADEDAVLQSKVHMMRELLLGFSESMDEDFWNAVLERR